MNKNLIVDELKKLSEADLVKVFYEAVSSRKKVVGAEVDDAIVIGNAGLADSDKMADLYISALPNAGSTELETMSQIGQCSRCRVNIQSASKEAICPICGSIVDCT